MFSALYIAPGDILLMRWRLVVNNENIIDVDLDSLITKSLRGVLLDALEFKIQNLILRGGRFSAKSSCVGVIAILGCMMYNRSAFLCVRYDNKVRERLVNNITAALDFLEEAGYVDITKRWKLKKSPARYMLLDEDTGKETGVGIYFSGADNVQSLKGYKPDVGTFWLMFVDEISDFNNYKDIVNLKGTILRGTDAHTFIAAYNPPLLGSSWTNKQWGQYKVGKALGYDEDSILIETPLKNGKKQTTVVHHSTYLDLLEDNKEHWIGDFLLAEAEEAAINNPDFYNWNYLGRFGLADSLVFKNVRAWDGVLSDIIKRNGSIYRGFDWGLGGADPCAYIEVLYDALHKDLYILKEWGARVKDTDVDEVAVIINNLNPKRLPIQCESQGPILNQQLRKNGVNALNVKKPPGSVMAGVLWLKWLNNIYICNKKDSEHYCPQCYSEFTEYSFAVDPKTDEILSKLQETNNHFVDACRYALSLIIKYS